MQQRNWGIELAHYEVIVQHANHDATGTYPNLIQIILFTNPSARAGYDTRSIFKRSLTGLNSEFSFS